MTATSSCTATREVVGPATRETHKGKGVKVLFPGNESWITCYLTNVRRLRAARLCPTHATLHAHAPRGPSSLNPTPTASHCGGGSAGEGHADLTPLPLLNARS